MIKKTSGLGRGLGSLIPAKPSVASAPSVQSGAPAAGTPITAAARPEGGVLKLPIGEIYANPEQPRLTFRHHELEELTNSIREYGIIQPLIVSPRSAGGYELIAGERRLRAAKLLNLTHVPAIVRPAAAQEKLLLALIENVQREDLNPLEEAQAYARLAAEFGLTQEVISRKVGKARSTVANALRLLELPEEIRQAISTGTLSAGSARAILALKDDRSRLAFFRKLVGKQVSTRQVEAGVRRASGRRGDPAVSAAEEQIRNRLGARVEIRKRNGKGQIIVHFSSEDEFTGLVAKLKR